MGIDYSGALLSAGFGGGFQETEVIFPPLRTAELSYPTLHRDAMVEVGEDVFQNRLEYIYGFYTNSKANGNEPFVMKSPLDGKFYVWQFVDDDLDIRLLDLFMGSSGLKIKQVYVRGLTPDFPDGSFSEE